jgi:putative membrane protein
MRITREELMSTFLKAMLVMAIGGLLALGAISARAISQSEIVTPLSTQSLEAAMQPALSEDDRSFMMEAGSGGMAEVEMGRLAATKGKSGDVKAFGQRMVRDHSKANSELMALAKRKGVTLPSDLNDEQKAEKAKLENLSGADFDREYMSMMVDDHNKDVKAFEDKAGNAADPELKRFVVKTLPTLKMHQSLANKIKAKQ